MNKRQAYKALSAAYRNYYRELDVLGYNGDNTTRDVERALNKAVRVFPVSQVMDIRDLVMNNILRPAGDMIEYNHWSKMMDRGMVRDF